MRQKRSAARTEAVRRKYTILAVIAMLLIMAIGMAACGSSSGDGSGGLAESIKGWINAFKGNLVGNSYDIWEYDNFGNRVLTVHGDKVAIAGDTDTSGAMSSYINITLDGHEWNHVGSTLVFCQEGVEMITDFSVPSELEVQGSASTGLMPADRVINDFKNFMGRDSVIIVFSQTGTPVCMFQGDSVNIEVPSSMPKMTQISIDGKMVYVHRANIDVLPAAAIQSTGSPAFNGPSDPKTP